MPFRPGVFGGLRLHQDYVIFLFDGALVVCRHVPEASERLPYKLVALLPITDIKSVAAKAQSTTKQSFVVQLAAEGSIQFKCKAADEVQKWIDDIQAAIGRV